MTRQDYERASALLGTVRRIVPAIDETRGDMALRALLLVAAHVAHRIAAPELSVEDRAALFAEMAEAAALAAGPDGIEGLSEVLGMTIERVN